MPAFDFGQLLNVAYWLERQPPPPSAYFVIYLVVFALGLLVTACFYGLYAPRAFRGNKIKLSVIRSASLIFGSVLLLGLIFVAMRYLGVPYLSLRLLPALMVVILVVLGIALAYFAYRMYPSRVARLQRQMIRQPYVQTRRPFRGRQKKKRPKR